MNENLDLTQILKDCPKGTKLYSPIFEIVEFEKIYINMQRNRGAIQIKYLNQDGETATALMNKDGRYYSTWFGECMLFPSEEQRDWSKFSIPRKPKEDLPEGSMVLMTDDLRGSWRVGFYYGKGNANCIIRTSEEMSCLWEYIIPYTFTSLMPTKEELDAMVITDNNNYGTTYWSTFQEE